MNIVIKILGLALKIAPTIISLVSKRDGKHECRARKKGSRD